MAKENSLLSAPLPIRAAIPLMVAGTVVITFWPILHNGFVWDDYPLLVNNAFLRGLNTTNLRWMFTSVETGHYQPVAFLLLAAVYTMAGMDAAAYHGLGIAIHALNALLVYMLAQRLISTAIPEAVRERPVSLLVVSGVVALAFAVHPLRVETVAWSTALRDLLCASFYLLSVLSYLDRARTGDPQHRVGVPVLLHAMALLSKPMAVTLPVVLLVLDVYPLRRLEPNPLRWFHRPSRSILIEKMPFILLSLGASVIAPFAEERSGAMVSFADFGLAQRCAQAAFGLVFYLTKTVFPIGLSPLYELPHPFDPLAEKFILSGVAVAVVSVFAVGVRHRYPALLAAWLCYVITLLPVLGFLHIGPFIAADRYTYIPTIAWMVVLGGILQGWIASPPGVGRRRRFRVAAGWAMGLAILTCCGLSFMQSRAWRDAEALWTQAVKVDPASPIARCNLAAAIADTGRLEEAWRGFQQVLAERPGYPPAVHGLAYVRAKQGRLKEAVELYTALLPITPRSAELHLDLGNALLAVGRHQDALDHYRKASEVWPSDLRARDAIRRATHLMTRPSP